MYNIHVKEKYMPPFLYSLAFWQALAYVVAAVVAFFTPYKLEAGVLLALVLAVLKLFNVVPELRARGLVEIPPFFYLLAFWQSLAYIIAAVVAWYTPYKVETGVLLVLFLAILKMFNIVPELRVRGLLK